MVIIATHTNADFDTFSSMIAAKKLYPNAELVITGDMEKTLKDTLAEINLPYPIRTLKDIDLNKVIRVVLVDVKSRSRIGRLADIIDNNNVEVHIYDHHPVSDKNIKDSDEIKGHYSVIKDYGSTATILTHIIKDEMFDLEPMEATLIMAGIYEDTGNLTYTTTTVKDYEAAAFLLGHGADLKKVSSFTERKPSRDEAESLSELLKSEKIYTIEGVDITIAEIDIENFSGEVSFMTQRLIDIEGTQCLFVLAHSEDRVHMVARSSIKEVDAGKVAQLLGGGGHSSAASATIKNSTLIDAKEKLLKALKEAIVTPKKAFDIMTSPAITIKTDATIKEALREMHKYNINAMVATKGGKVEGLITRQVADKGTFHGVGGDKVEKFMTTVFKTVEEDAPMQEVRDIVMARGQRIIPVMKKSNILGVITRTDLLKLLQEELQEKPSEDARKKHRDISGLMQNQLPQSIMDVLRTCGETADELNYKAYAVGGFVRDIVMRRKNFDIDIVIEGDGIKFAKRLARKKKLKIKTHERFRTAVVSFPCTSKDGDITELKVDIATARLEYYQKPGALPTVEQSSLKLDLFRRDFTINTLAVSINQFDFGTLVDYFNGQKDIKEKSINILHNLSFLEDPTRAFRAVRFSVRFGFKIGKHTEKLILSTVRTDLHSKISGPRIGEELKNILKESRSLQCLKMANDYGLLKLIDKDINWDKTRDKNFASAIDTCKWYDLLYSDEKADRRLVLFLALTANMKLKDLTALTKRLAFTSNSLITIIKLRHSANRVLENITKGKYKKQSTMYFALQDFPIETVLYMMASAKTDKTKKVLSHYITELRHMKAETTGTDLKKLGVNQGPIMGKLLADALTARLDGTAKNKEEELELLRKKI